MKIQKDIKKGEKMKQLRYSAVPLMNVDPFFSVWSFADNLYDDAPRNWCGKRNAMTGLLVIDGKIYRFLGKVQNDNRVYFKEPDVLWQKSVRVEATTTVYEFENNIINLKLTFRTPLLCDDLLLMSRPVSYISYEAKFKDNKNHDLVLYFDVSSEMTVDNTAEKVSFGKTDYSIYCGKGNKDVLLRSGDEILIEWGNLHLIAPNSAFKIISNAEKRKYLTLEKYEINEINSPVRVCEEFPVISCQRVYRDTNYVSDFFCIAYEDFASIEYFGEKTKGYWTTNGDSFEKVCKKAISEYETICKKCDEFDKKLRIMGEKISERYADLICLAYRQVVSAHKLIKNNGELQFLSKECFSNGCIGTVDVTYPSMPMFLLFNPDLVEGMLNPIFKYVEENHGWNYDFAPHDVGQYPLANGQVYGYNEKEKKFNDKEFMPVEECGNMLITVLAICKSKKDYSYAKKHYETLKKWANYLLNAGYDPESQLCTDDFAGHLEHNANLSVKGILGIASFGIIAKEVGEENNYLEIAKNYAKKWKEEAKADGRYALSFDKKDTWSMKYNLAMDRVLNINVFDKDIFETEVSFYKKKINEFGLPLDNREDYTKSDWQIWTTCLTDDKEYLNMIVDAMWNFINKTENRVPFADWYHTTKPESILFQARPVQGGIFLPLLKF